jgi:hypothetical protein
MTGYAFDTKIAVVLREDLASWQRVNAAAFLTSGVAHAFPQLMGEPYEDADGTGYLPMFGQPVFVLEGDKEALCEVRSRAIGRGIATSVFTHDLFTTGNDDDNRAAVRAVDGASLDVVAVAVHGPKNAVDRILKGTRRHP